MGKRLKGSGAVIRKLHHAQDHPRIANPPLMNFPVALRAKSCTLSVS